MKLPPIGQPAGDGEIDLASYLTGLAEESRDFRLEWEPLVDVNYQVFVWGQEDGPPDEDQIIPNEIQNAIIAATDIQTKEPPTAKLEPVEVGEPGTFYWAGTPEEGLMLGLQPFEVAEWPDDLGNVQPPTPLDKQTAGLLKSVMVPEEASPALPLGAIRPEDLVELNDRLVADTYQTVFDVLWDRSGVDLFIRDLLLDTNVQGWALALYEFDDTYKRHCLRHLPVKQVHLDATQRDVSEMAYAGFDLPLDAEEAKAQFPGLAETIDAEAAEGIPVQIDGALSNWSSTYNRQFRRKMVTFRIMWLRNQIVPMTKDEALALGLVEEIQPYEPDQGIAPAEPEAADVLPVDADAVGGADRGVLQQPVAEATPEAVGAAPVAAGGADAAGQYVLVETGEPTAPGLPNWPTRLGIRQVTQIGSKVVDDRESEFFDIPIFLNRNIPVPGQRPWGMGEPYRLKAIQQAMSRQLTAMVTHAEYFASPVTAMSRSMHESLGKEYQDATVKPGVTLIVEDELWARMNGQVHAIHDPPQLPPALAQLFPMLKGLIQEQSGHADVLQGRTGASARSGTAIDLLQSAATSMIGYKAQRLGDFVRRLTKEMLHNIVHRMSVEDLEKIVSRFPRHILELIHERARFIEWDVKVEVKAGNGGLQIQKRQLAQLDLQAGAISLETYQEEAGRDPRLEEKRMERQLQRQARLGMLTGPGEEQGEGGGQKKGPDQGKPPGQP